MSDGGQPAPDSIDALLAALEQSLEAEQHALIGCDPDALTASLEDKHVMALRVAEAFNGLDETRRRAIATRYRRTLERCRSLNETSGRTVARLLTDTRTALELLGAGSRTERYDATGAFVSDSSSRSLGRG